MKSYKKRHRAVPSQTLSSHPHSHFARLHIKLLVSITPISDVYSQTIQNTHVFEMRITLIGGLLVTVTVLSTVSASETLVSG